MIRRYEYYNANIEPRSDGRIVFYADTEKWVQAEIDERDRTISRLNNDLCDRRVSLEAALKLCKERDEEIAALKSLVDGASDIVEIYPTESPAQKEWKADWLKKAREALK